MSGRQKDRVSSCATASGGLQGTSASVQFTPSDQLVATFRQHRVKSGLQWGQPAGRAAWSVVVLLLSEGL